MLHVNLIVIYKTFKTTSLQRQVIINILLGGDWIHTLINDVDLIPRSNIDALTTKWVS